MTRSKPRRAGGIDTARRRGYNAGMVLRRATILPSLVIYLAVGVCRQACALDFPAASRAGAAVTANSGRCHDEAPASGKNSRRRPAPCCVLGSQDASVLLPAQTALLPATASSGVAVDAALMMPDAATPSELAARAPSGAAPSVLAPALHGPRPPPYRLAVL